MFTIYGGGVMFASNSKESRKQFIFVAVGIQLTVELTAQT
jgi:hypothetical protein